MTPISSLPEDSGIFQGRYKMTLTTTPTAQFTDGDYAVTVHDKANSNNVVAELASTMHSGDDATVFPQAASSGDPWATTLPGAYATGTAGAILGKNLDAQVSSRSTYAGGVDPWSVSLPGSYASGTAGAIIGHNIDAQVLEPVDVCGWGRRLGRGAGDRRHQQRQVGLCPDGVGPGCDPDRGRRQRQAGACADPRGVRRRGVRGGHRRGRYQGRQLLRDSDHRDDRQRRETAPP